MARKTALVKPATDDTKPVDDKEDFWADERRSKCLDMVLIGTPKAVIARELEVHRNTINNWCQDPRFIAEANQRVREHQSSKRLRRMMTTNQINDRVERVLNAATREMAEKVTDDGKFKAGQRISGEEMRTMREIAYEYRAFREEERKDFGDDVKKIAMQSQHTLTGDVHVTHSINDTPFKEFFKQAVERKIIDVESIEGETQGHLLLEAATQVMQETDILDIIEEEDRASEALVANENDK